jgi:hypothetical protein
MTIKTKALKNFNMTGGYHFCVMRIEMIGHDLLEMLSGPRPMNSIRCRQWKARMHEQQGGFSWL